MSHETLEVLVVNGVEGPSVYIDGYRVAGPKPWGGGEVLYSWKARPSDLRHVLDSLDALRPQEEE